MRVPSCSSVSSALGEPLLGTASQVKRWLLIEDPGPWGYDALRHNRVPRELFGELSAWATTVSARIVLIRRGARLVGTPRRIFIASSDPTSPWLVSLSENDLDAITAIDRARFKSGDVPGERVDNVFLICTHGRHDRCCSVRGNPVARALCARYNDAAWECSHIGGDRFAANVVCLPRGAYFGRVPSVEAEQLTEDYARGVLDLERFRGWSFFPFAVQAAEITLRRQLGLDRIADVVTEAWTKPRDGRVGVSMTTAQHGAVEATVTVTKSQDEFFLTCRAEQPGRPPLFETVL